MNAIPQSVLNFLSELAQNNNREWFAEHKKQYEQARKDVVALADTLLERMRPLDAISTPSGHKSVFRIYRDTRFSGDKTPYKTHFGLVLERTKPHHHGDYYVHLMPGGAFVGGGFWELTPDQLKRIREDIDLDADELRAIVEDPAFVQRFGGLQGEQLKTAPRGFDKAHRAVDLLRYKQFLMSHPISDAELTSPDLADRLLESFAAMRPLMNYLSMVLTTDANGEPIV